jgi:hypothetical protein
MAAKLKIEKGGMKLKKILLLWEFPFGSYVKLSSAVVAILVGVLKCRTQFWKRTKSNFCGMILGWPPSKVVSGDPDFQPRWPPS